MTFRLQAFAAPAGRPRAAALAFAAALALQAGCARAQDDGGRALRLDGRLRLGGEFVHLPGHERMGLAGLTELFNLGGEWWGGPGVYGAATGRRGGLFVPGFEGAWSHPFGEMLALDAGLFVGGGGGAAAPVGGGLMLRPHLDLVVRLPYFYMGPTWSQVRFPNGSIKSDQFGWMFNFASSVGYRRADGLRRGAPADGSADGLGFDRIDATFTLARPRRSIDTSGAPLIGTIGLVGLRAERTVSGPLWAGIETAGAASGGVAGYAEVLGTAGLRWPVAGDRLSLGVRASLGLGGGGGIDTGGGLLAKAAAGATLRLTDTLGLGAEIGMAKAPRRAHFQAATGSVSLNWLMDAPQGHPFNLYGTPTEHAVEATRMEFVGGVERYRAGRKDGTATRPLDAVTLALNRFITPNLYVSGQAHSAYAGGAGAYSVGLFGLGVQVPLSARVRLGAEALVGAAGGGGVDTHGGGIAQGRGYADVALTDAVSLRIGAGKVRSAGGGVDAPSVDAAMAFRFGVDRRK